MVSFALLIGRILWLAERQKDTFSRVYGYAVASILFSHWIINIGMTIGLVPTIEFHSLSLAMVVHPFGASPYCCLYL